MRFINYLQTKIPATVAFIALFGLTSCGSYQYVGQDSDGIYGPSENNVEYEEEVVTNETEPSNNYYKNYFKEKSNELELMNKEGEVFTDIDSYEGNYNEDVAETTYQGYAGWGEESDDITINIYSNNFGYYNYWNRPYYAWNRWGYRPYYSSWGIGYGYAGFGWNTGFYDPFWNPPYYGYNSYYGYYGYPYNTYYGYYGRSYNHGRRVTAYNTSRRSSLNTRTSPLSRRVSANASRSNSSSSSTTPRTRTSTTPRTKTNTSTPRPRVKTNTTTPRPRIKTNTSTPRPRANTPSSSPRSNNGSSSTPRRSNSSSTRGGGSSRTRG